MSANTPTVSPNDVIARADALRRDLSGNFRDQLVEAMYAEAETIARRAVKAPGQRRLDWDQRLDRLITSPIFGLPIMLLLLSIVVWLTIPGANVPSKGIADALVWM